MPIVEDAVLPKKPLSDDAATMALQPAAPHIAPFAGLEPPSARKNRWLSDVAILCYFAMATLIVHLILGGRYGFHRDELATLEDARNLYVARTYAYVASGKQGVAIVDVEHPEQPRLDQMFNAGGEISDANDVKLGMVSSSLFAYIADGHNGLRVVQLFSPRDNPAFGGFSPRPTPKLIATFRTHGPALAISKGIDRDRAVDESGNQLAVFGRRGARPFNRQEMERMYLLDGEIFTVTDEAPGTAPQKQALRQLQR